MRRRLCERRCELAWERERSWNGAQGGGEEGSARTRSIHMSDQYQLKDEEYRESQGRANSGRGASISALEMLVLRLVLERHAQHWQEMRSKICL